jgi:biopolymer transport protein ExbD
MAMNLAAAGGSGEEQVVAAINTTPLVDVMLVLLIIFLITIPVANFSVPVELPKRTNALRESTPKDVVISVDAQGGTFWFDARIAGRDDLQQRLRKIAAQNPQPEVHIRGDARGDYAPVGRILLACQRAGILKVGFITEPPPRG